MRRAGPRSVSGGLRQRTAGPARRIRPRESSLSIASDGGRTSVVGLVTLPPFGTLDHPGMKNTLILLIAVLVLAGCGGDDGSLGAGQTSQREDASTGTGGSANGGAKKDAPTGGRKGTTITAGDSEFGRMLFDSKKQAIYIFENDSQNTTVCYGECAEAWPPVFTNGKPRAGHGVEQALLGTVKRRDGKLQVTYAGKPLYFYAHEGPGEVRCHNVDLNGGLWWVLGPDGERLA